MAEDSAVAENGGVNCLGQMTLKVTSQSRGHMCFENVVLAYAGSIFYPDLLTKEFSQRCQHNVAILQRLEQPRFLPCRILVARFHSQQYSTSRSHCGQRHLTMGPLQTKPLFRRKTAITKESDHGVVVGER